ncbi:MAG: ABC transporter substrate-binding protein [Pseudomonadota bacterium]|nr:ABC transporter substrate-binding protein [Pseudomonadota bacterium]
MKFRKNALLAAMAAAVAMGAATVQGANLKVACGSGPGFDHCKKIIDAWAKDNGHTVEPISTPNDSSAQLSLYQQILAAKSTDIDIYNIDVVWPGIVGHHMVDLKPAAGEVINDHFPAIIENNTVNGKLIAMPSITDAALLFYRKDLLEKYGESVPETWEQLTAIAEKVQKGEREAGNNSFWGFVWQGRAYEGLTCDALEWVASHNGGTIVEPDGTISINNPNAVQALTTARGWVDNVSPPGVLNYQEEEARGVFQAGNAMFMRNWPYAWSLSQGDDSPVKGKVGTAPLPKGGEGGRHAATLGGWQFSVSQYSPNQEAAIQLVLHLTGKEVQKDRAIVLSNLPTIVSLYDDPDILAANPFFAEMKPVLASAVARPSTVTGAKYNQVSSEFYNAVFAVLSGNKTAEQSLADLERSLNRLSRGGKW